MKGDGLRHGSCVSLIGRYFCPKDCKPIRRGRKGKGFQKDAGGCNIGIVPPPTPVTCIVAPDLLVAGAS